MEFGTAVDAHIAGATGLRPAVDQFGFDVVDAGPLAEGWRFERARPVYCHRFDKAGLVRALEATNKSQFVAEGSWRA